jgi:hypothetical protein
MSTHEDLGVALRRHYRTTANAEPAMGQLDAVLVETATTPQRPSWMLRERWLPMSVVIGATTIVPRVPWRMIGVAALLVLALAVVLLVVGNQPRRLPPPFGPARNGLIAYEFARDIYVGDPVTGKTKAIVTGFEDDLSPVFSPDGTWIAFLRRQLADPSLDKRDIVVVRPDGTDLRVITREPLSSGSEDQRLYECCAWSPDSSAVIALVPRIRGEEPNLVLMAYPVIGAEAPDYFAPGVPSLSNGWGPHGLEGFGNVYAALRPPRGDRVLVVNDAASDSGQSLTVVDRDGSNTMTPLQLMFYSLSSPAWSPDGSRILFTASVDVPGPCGSCWAERHIYIVDADGSGLRRLTTDSAQAPPGTIAVETGATWSPDGKRIAMNRWVGPADMYQSPWDRGGLVVVDVETGIERAIDVELSYVNDSTWSWIWSPDGRSILLGRVYPPDSPDQMVLVDVESGEPAVLPWDHLSVPTWQRLAL